MKMNKKLLLASTVALSALPLLTTRAEEQPQNWTARTVEQIKADITSNENQQTYTVQYGDTLGNIAQAMNIDLVDLAKINQIANADLIFPGTVLTITTNGQNEITAVEIQSYQAGNNAGLVTEDYTAVRFLVLNKPLQRHRLKQQKLQLRLLRKLLQLQQTKHQRLLKKLLPQ